jgi:uncharacterized glyoxalase superfamily protein PhnB
LHSLTTQLWFDGDCGEAVNFYKKAFDAEIIGEVDKMPDGRVMHAEVQIGDTRVMMGEPMDPYPARPCNLYMYVPNVDEVYQRAVKAGGKSLSEPKDQFYGDRSGGVEDPSGNTWWIATHVEDVSVEEMQRRMQALCGGQH